MAVEELVIAVRFRGDGTASLWDEALRQRLWEKAQEVCRETGGAYCADLVLDHELADF